MADRIKIGIIGNIDFKEKLSETISDADKSLDITFHWYSHQEEAGTNARELAKHCDAILFSGPVPYYLAMEEGGICVPVEYVKYDEASLLKAFFELRGRDIDLSKISIDTISSETIREVYSEIGVSATLNSMPLNQEGLHDDVVRFHVENFTNGNTLLALTCRSIVKYRLDVLKIPCYHMYWNKRTILNALDLLIDRYLKRKYQGSQIAIGFLKIKAQTFNGSLVDAKRRDLDFQQFLLDCSESLRANLLDIGNGLHLFYTTYGALNQCTSNFTRVPKITLPKHLKATYHIGIGTGKSSTAAEDGARHALHKAESQGSGETYVMLDGKELIGPLGTGESKLVRVEDSELCQLAEHTGVNVINLAKIIEFTSEEPSKIISASELAQVLSISTRTARRILSRLSSSGLAQASGEQMPRGNGRPTKLFRLELHPLLTSLKDQAS